MLRYSLLAAVAAAAVTLASAPAQAADNITTDTWYSFSFTTAGTPLVPGILPGVSPAGVIAPAAPWTITLAAPTHLRVTDVEISGDVFTFYDNGGFLGTTSAPVAFGSSVGECISCALADPNYSHGDFLLGAGTHSLTGVFDGSINYGDGDFRIGSVPEPASWALMLMGFGGLGAVMRSRRNMAASAA